MRILAAVDIDAAGEAVLSEAVKWAESLNATLDVAYVDEYAYDGGIIRDPAVRQLVVDQWDRIRDSRRGSLRNLHDALPEAVRGDVHYVEGRASQQIVALAENTAADLVIVATHGRTGLPHLFLGSVAERVVRGAPCPVMVLRLAPKDQGPDQA